MRHIPDSYQNGRHINAARFVMITAAFEWEFRRLYPNGIKKSEETIDAENNTKKILLSTEDGKKACQVLLEIFDQWKDATIGDVSSDEMVAFSKTLKKLSDNSIDVLS